MGNQQVNGTPGGPTSMSNSASRRAVGGAYDGQQQVPGGGMVGGGSGGGVGVGVGQSPYGGASGGVGVGIAAPTVGGGGVKYHHPTESSMDYGRHPHHPGRRYPPGDVGGVGRTASDMSMTDMSSGDYPNPPPGTSGVEGGNGRQQQHGVASTPGGGGGVGGMTLDLATISAAEEDSVPTVFRWEHGGRNVYITGTFNGWTRQIPMHRSGNDFTYIHNLRRGKHAFKFIVDDEWRFAPDQPTVADIEGRINNFIDVTDFKAYTGDTEFENERHAVHCSRAAEAAAVAARRNEIGAVVDDDVGSSSGSRATGDLDENSSGGGSGAADGEVYGHSMPDLDEYTKEPPPLPPHLRHIILNKPPQLQDTAALPVPQHVALNHLYCTAIKDNMMVLGITQRYKMKSCTTVYYSPC
ncbi:hypothetical protein ACHAXA_008583 [Cyclostephanos tholiformis]|uniref:Association with the SNF1 complex (ASC) domain-containing protein n=1 Tax=Cyclostephanos tholiformis TaxID=382380 RepID=A0ABD3SPS8_9STRA